MTTGASNSSLGGNLKDVEAAAANHIRLEPKNGWVAIDLKELWRYRELLWILALRDIRVRYKQTALGVIWIILSPLITATVFTIIFSGLARIPSDNIPYPVFAYSGILLFNLFSQCTSAAVGSLVGNRHLISKIYFPRLIYPIAPVLSATLDFGIGAIFLAGIAFVYHVPMRPLLLLSPLFVVFTIVVGLGLGFWLGALNVQYRDISNLIPFLLQIWMYSSPVVYPLSLAKTQWPHGYYLLLLNPMSNAIAGFRWLAMGGEPPPTPFLLLSIITAAGVLIGGMYFFRRMERVFADIV